MTFRLPFAPALMTSAVAFVLLRRLERSWVGLNLDAVRLDETACAVFGINVARGKIVDTAALVAALRENRLAGACLDVTDPEPLPKESPLWAMKNVVLTPHVASESDLSDERAWAMLKENLRRFAAGEPLQNVVDTKAGY